MIKPHAGARVTVREAAVLLGVTTAAVRRAILAARMRGEAVPTGGERYEVAPGRRNGKWAATYAFGAIRRLMTPRRDAA